MAGNTRLLSVIDKQSPRGDGNPVNQVYNFLARHVIDKQSPRGDGNSFKPSRDFVSGIY